MKKTKLDRPHNAGTMTKSGFMGMLRSALRSKSRWWKPRLKAKLAARRPSQSSNPRQKWEYQCQGCKGWFPDKDVQVHHEIEAGSLKCLEDLPGFTQRLFAETGWVVLCSRDHNRRHNNGGVERRGQKTL